MTFYKYFSNKMMLVRYLWDGWIDDGLSKMDEIDALDIPLPEKIQMLFEWKSGFLSNISKVFINDIMPLNLSYDRVYQHLIEFIIKAQIGLCENTTAYDSTFSSHSHLIQVIGKTKTTRSPATPMRPTLISRPT